MEGESFTKEMGDKINPSSLLLLFGRMCKIAWQTSPKSTIGLLLIRAAQSLLPLATAWITKILFDILSQNLGAGSNIQFPKVIFMLLGAQTILIVLSQTLGYVGNFLNSEFNRQIDFKIQFSSYQKINNLHGLEPFENPNFQDIIQLGLQGAHIGLSQAFATVSNIVQYIITIAGFLGILFSYNLTLTILVGVAALPRLFVETKLGKKRFTIAHDNNPLRRRANYYTYLISNISFIKEIRLFQLGEYLLGEFKNLYQHINLVQRNQQKCEIKSHFSLSLFSNLISNTVFIAIIFQAFSGQISLGDVSLYSTSVGSVQAALSGLISTLASINEFSLFFSQYTKLMELPQPIILSPSPRPTPPLASSIEIQGVSFRYSENHPWVLRDLSLSIPYGKCLALVGLNGAGKTTLVKLLTRMYDPSVGNILWDGIDIRDLDLAAMRGRIGAIFQDFVHFDLTAFENIAFGNVSALNNGGARAAQEAVRRAAAKAGVHETIQSLPQGYDTTLSRWLVDEGQGVDLSGGEWQKIALARLFVRDADFLILDEPTAALDAQAESEIYNQFMTLIKGKTCMLISHRFSSIRMADVIAVLDNGRIIEYGNHEELMTCGGKYAQLYRLQAERIPQWHKN